MKYHVIKFDRESVLIHNTIKKWWGEKVGATLSDLVFSDYGYMLIDDEGEQLISAFLYPIQGCGVAMLGFPIANPTLEREERKHAIRALTTYIEHEAKKLNYRFIISYAGSKGAVEMFNGLGYQIYDKEVVNFGKVL